MCMNSVQVHTRPHHGGKIWRPHHIGKHEKLSLTYIQELITSIVIVVLNVFSLCILVQLGTEKRMVELASSKFGLMGRQ